MYNSPLLRLCRYLSGWVYGFHMPLFFMLSGAVLAIKPIGKFDNIIKSKFKRLLIPYFVYGWLFMLPVKYMGNFYNKDTLKSAMNGFLSGMDSGHLWFLISLFWCLLIFSILYKLLKRLNVNSIYFLLLITGILQLTYNYLPFDLLGLKKGIGYIFYFALGYVFETERKNHNIWNIRKTALTYVILFILEILNKKYGILNSFFIVICGAFQTYLFADLCSRLFKNISSNKLWNILISDLFYVYLLHDPMEYIVLKIFMNNEYLNTSIGCILYTFSRTVVIFLISILFAEIIKYIKSKCLQLLNEDL